MSIHSQIEHFCNYFADYRQSYVLIGGAACAVWYQEQFPAFRPTRDLDLVLVLESLSDSFVHALKNYLNEFGYRTKERNNIEDGRGGKRVMYRFLNPATQTAPFQLELLSRNGMASPILDADCHIAPVVAGDQYTSLSCIVLHDDYYHFVCAQSKNLGNLSLLSVPALMLLKIKACLNLKAAYLEKNTGNGSDNSLSNIRKHRNDVFFMLLNIPESEMQPPVSLPPPLYDDLNDFIAYYHADSDEWSGIFNHLRSKYDKAPLKNLTPETLLDALLHTYAP